MAVHQKQGLSNAARERGGGTGGAAYAIDLLTQLQRLSIRNAFELFKKMIQKINKDVGSFLIKGDLAIKKQGTLREAKIPRGLDRSQMKEERGDLLSQAHSDTQSAEQGKPQPVKVEKKVGRNDLCPCGSGKKYKHCHGK